MALRSFRASLILGVTAAMVLTTQTASAQLEGAILNPLYRDQKSAPAHPFRKTENPREDLPQQSVGVLKQPDERPLRKSIEDALKSQLSLVSARMVSEEVFSRIESLMEDFKLKYPNVRMNPERNPFLFELISAAVEKSMTANFPVIYKSVVEKTNAHYSAYAERMDSAQKAELFDVMPRVFSDLKSPENRAEIMQMTSQMIHREWAEKLRNYAAELKEKAKQSKADENVKTSEVRLPVLIGESSASGATGENRSLPVNIILEETYYEKIRQDSPENLKKNFARRMESGAIEFTRQSTFFNIPVAVIAIAELGHDYSKDPLAFERFLTALKDPVAHASFAAFIATNHKISAQLQSVMNGTLPRAMLPYIGMSAGLLASSVFSEMYNDKDVWKCARSMAGLAPDTKRCEAAYNNWVPSKKIDQYTPNIIALSSSAFLSGALQAAVKSAPHAKNIMWSFRLGGLRMARAASQLATSGSGAGGPVSFIVSNGIFLIADKFVAAPIDDWWKRTTLQKWDMSKALANSESLGTIEKGFRLLFFDRIELRDKATALPEVHKNFQDSLKFYEDRNWTAISLKSCLPADVTSVDLFDAPTSRKPEIQACLAQRDLLNNLKDLSEVQGKWRQFLLRKVNASAEAWTQSLSGFTTMFNASSKAYRQMIEGIHSRNQGKESDLGYYAFAKTIFDTISLKATDQQTEDERDSNEGLYPTNVGGFQTPEIVDYLIMSMACGPDMKQSPTLWQQTISMSWMPWSWLSEKAPSFVSTTDIPAAQNQMIQTPFGQKFKFLPPALVKKPGELCEQYNVMNAKDGRQVGPTDANGYWANGNYSVNLLVKGKVYKGVLDYIIKNIDQELVGDLPTSSEFDLWWDDNVISPTQTVWETYRKDYIGFLRKNLVPLVSNSKTRQGCHNDDSSCLINNPKVTLNDDLTGSYRNELNYYKEILKSILKSTGGESAQRLFAFSFDGLIKQVGATVSGEKDQFDLKVAESMVSALKVFVDGQMKQIPAEDYRRKVVGTSFGQLSNLVAERGRIRQFLNILVLSNRNEMMEMKSGAVKSKDIRARY